MGTSQSSNCDWLISVRWESQSGQTSKPYSCFFSFRADMTSSRLAAGARQKHRGPRMGATKAPPKQSVQRRTKLFAENMVTDTPMPQAVHSADHRSQEEKDALRPWVCLLQFKELKHALSIVTGPAYHHKVPVSASWNPKSHRARRTENICFRFFRSYVGSTIYCKLRKSEFFSTDQCCSHTNA